VAGVPEDANGGKAAVPFPDSDNGEAMWCAYGWPLQAGRTGNLVFFVSQNGVILQTQNRGAGAYSTTAGGPNFDAAFTLPLDMSSVPAVGIPANDGNLWVPVN
jgi:hypothetical protein